jgi:hypothetical protein
MRDAVKSCIENDTASRRPHQELDDYLTALLEDVDNVVAWWGVSVLFIVISLELTIFLATFYSISYYLAHC